MERDPLRANLLDNMVIIEALKARLNRGREPGLFFFRDSHEHRSGLANTVRQKIDVLRDQIIPDLAQQFSPGAD